MKFIFFDLDETIFVVENRTRFLSPFQSRRIEKEIFVTISNKKTYPLYRQLHHLVFKKLNSDRENFKTIILTTSRHKKPDIRDHVNHLFDTNLFNHDFKFEQSLTTETFESVPWLDLDYYGKIKKEEKIDLFFKNAYGKSAAEFDCYLIDNLPMNLIGSNKSNINVIDSSAPNYYQELMTLIFTQQLIFEKDAW